jgi:chromosomal replication initiation ATPase DnaA
MAHASEYDCGFDKRTRVSTEALLDRLKQHHDYSVPHLFVTRKEVIEIRSEPESPTSIEICVLPVPEGRLTVDAIKRVVCKHFKISHSEMISPRRHRNIQRPRMVAMYLAREFTSHGFPTLGRYFRRDHTSVLHSVRVAAQLVADNDPIARDISYLSEVLSA